MQTLKDKFNERETQTLGAAKTMQEYVQHKDVNAVSFN